MLYLEDYLELIEHLPQEFKDRFTQIREMDLQVQNDLDKLDLRVDKFFTGAKDLELDIRDAQYQQIYQDFTKNIEDSEEKVIQATQIYDLVDKYLRRLDIELQKFKIELEADNAGITEIIEKRVEKEYEAKQNSPSQLLQKKKIPLSKRYDQKNGSRLFLPDKSAGNGEKYSHKTISSSQPAYPMQKGRTKNSSDSQPQYPSSFAADNDGLSEIDSKNKKRNKRSRNSTSYTNYPDVESSTSSDFFTQDYSANASEEEVFCVCRGVSYGEMIQCENEKNCRFEWFHYSCIGMKQAPKGSWYCDYCTDAGKGDKRSAAATADAAGPEKKKKKREKSSGSKDKTLSDYVY